jgi:CRP/FNR family transcriptional regulator, cyclic AMP receptor protein
MLAVLRGFAIANLLRIQGLDGKRMDATESSSEDQTDVPYRAPLSTGRDRGAEKSVTFVTLTGRSRLRKTICAACRSNRTALNTVQMSADVLESDRRGLVPWNKAPINAFIAHGERPKAHCDSPLIGHAKQHGRLRTTKQRWEGPMRPTNFDPAQQGMSGETEPPSRFDDAVDHQASVSTALASVFRGKFCDLILPNRKAITFDKHQVIYSIGDEERTFFFLQNGFAKVGTITSSGREVIYDVRRGGDVVGELCALERRRMDQATALEPTDAIPVPFEELMELVLKKPGLVSLLIDVFGHALKEAYAQVNILAVDDMVHRLAKVLINLAQKLGQASGSPVEIPTYLTQEEIAQMVAARRERVSTALNSLRRLGLVHYSTRGRLVVNVSALESHSA